MKGPVKHALGNETYRGLLPPVGEEERMPPAPVLPLWMEGRGGPAGRGEVGV